MRTNATTAAGPTERSTVSSTLLPRCSCRIARGAARRSGARFLTPSVPPSPEMNGFPLRIHRVTARMTAGMRISVTRMTSPLSMLTEPNSPPIPSIGMTDIRIIGTIIPSPKTVMQGTVRDELYLSPMALTESRATSDASLSSLSLSPELSESDAAMQRRMAFLYPDACWGSPSTSADRASPRSQAPLVSVLLTALRNRSLERRGPSSATERMAVSRDPPDSTAVVIIPMTVGHSSMSLRTSGPFMPHQSSS